MIATHARIDILTGIFDYCTASSLGSLACAREEHEKLGRRAVVAHWVVQMRYNYDHPALQLEAALALKKTIPAVPHLRTDAAILGECMMSESKNATPLGLRTPRQMWGDDL